MQGRGADLALEQELDSSQPALDLADPADHPHRVELLRSGFIDVLALGHGEDQAILLEGFFDRPQRPRPSHADRDGQAGKDHRAAQRQYGQCLTFRHHSLLLWPTPMFQWILEFMTEGDSSREGLPQAARSVRTIPNHCG